MSGPLRWQDIDGWLSEEEGAALQALARGRRVLELGAWKGRSTVCMAGVAECVVSVDAHRGDAHTGPADTHAEFVANLDRAGVRGRVVPMLVDHATLTPGSVGNLFGLVLVDGSHDADSVERDTRLAAHAVSGRGGVVAWHDWSYESVRDGVRRAGIEPAAIDGRAGDLAWKTIGGEA